MSGDSHKNYALAHRAFFITKRSVKLLTWNQLATVMLAVMNTRYKRRNIFDNYFHASTGYRNMADKEINQRAFDSMR